MEGGMMPWQVTEAFVPCCKDMEYFLKEGIPYYTVTPTKKGIKMENWNTVDMTFPFCPFCGQPTTSEGLEC
jgi:hypothetical protein